jgi:hypothetical protein
MKNYQIGLAVMIVCGAIAGSTFATVTLLHSRQSNPPPQMPLSQPKADFPPLDSSVASLSPKESPIASLEASPWVTPAPDESFPLTSPDNDVSSSLFTSPSSSPSPIALQSKLTKTTTQKLPQNTPAKVTEFSQFRVRLLDAVQRADADFIRAIVTPETQWNYGGTLNLDTYNIDSNQSKFWAQMDKALSQGCGLDSQAKVENKEPGSAVWMCPDLTRVKQSIQPDRPNYGNLAILGKNVNVRSQPRSRGRVVGLVSYDYVSLDSSGYDSLPAQTQEQLKVDVVNGWTPVRLRTGQRGWVQNRYVYDEENDYRVSFVRQSEQWRLHYFLPGNGN